MSRERLEITFVSGWLGRSPRQKQDCVIDYCACVFYEKTGGRLKKEIKRCNAAKIQPVTPPLLILSVPSLKYLWHTKQFCLSLCIFILITAVFQWSQKVSRRREAGSQEVKQKGSKKSKIKMHSNVTVFSSIWRQDNSSTGRVVQAQLPGKNKTQHSNRWIHITD